MTRGHIAIFTLLGAAHVYPTLGVCTELIKRGYRVTYATDDNFAHIIRQTGAEPMVFRAPKLENLEKILPYPSSDDTSFWRLYASMFCPWFLTTAASTVSELESFYGENAPDLVLYDRFSFAGRILARRLKTPAIQLWAHFAHQRFLIREDGVYSNPEPMLGFSRLLDSFLAAYGIDDTDNLWYTEKLNIYFVPREFQFHGDSFDDRSCFVGACLNRPFRAVWENNCGGKPIILVSESAASIDSSYLQTCIDAFADSDYHVVLSMSRSGPTNSLSTLPANFEVNQHAYNLEILPHAVLTICQAGMGTALESIYYGVPVLAVPRTPYHAEVGYRVAELGLGSYLPERSMTMDAIRENADKILGNAAILDRAKLMQQVFRRSGGAEMAVNRIEEFLKG